MYGSESSFLIGGDRKRARRTMDMLNEGNYEFLKKKRVQKGSKRKIW